MTNVLLINPPGTHQTRVMPLGILYIAAVLREAGHNCAAQDYYHLRRDAAKKTLLDYLQYNKSKGIVFQHIGFSMKTDTRIATVMLAEAAKKAYPQTIISVGGVHPTFMNYQIYENYKFINKCFCGEAERSFLEVVESCDKGFDDVYHSCVSSMEQDIDTLPMPAYYLLEPKVYGSGQVISSRGCMSNCQFCSVSKFWHGWRGRKPEKVFEEMKTLKEIYGYQSFVFLDDAMGVDNDQLIELCGMIETLNVPWHTTCRANDMNPKTLAAMKKSGCYEIAYGIESGSPEMLKSIGKQCSVEQNEQAVRWTLESGIKPTLLIMTGNPGETRGTINETIGFLNRLPSGYDIGSIDGGVWVMPGTRLYEKSKKEGFITDDYWLKDQKLPKYTVEHSEHELLTFVHAILRREKI